MKSYQINVPNSLLKSQMTKVESEFSDRFGHLPTVVVAAPGRVNLIGEHIDYNDGFVLPLAIERYVCIAAARRENETADSNIGLCSLNLSSTKSIQIGELSSKHPPNWVSYIEGVVAGFIDLDVQVPSFDAVIDSTVPMGGGLSSSAALEVATATLLEQLTGHELGRQEKALLCQKAEHTFAGVPCGIMDQTSSVYGELDKLMLIDCRSLEVETVPFQAPDISILIANSNVKHELNASEYGQRRAQCEAALGKLGESSWRDVTPDQLEQHRLDLTPVEFRRGQHVVSEIERTLAAAHAIVNNGWQLAGELMYASHESLRDNYQVSCSELDLLVEIASKIGLQGGVFGSRMTGGGFGGCTVSLVQTTRLESVVESLTTQYESITGIHPACFSSRPAQGAHVLKSKSGATDAAANTKIESN